MKISYNKLQTYFEGELPSPEKLAEAFTFHAFDVEGIEKSGDDTIFDIKILPDRAYAKSVEGIAREVATILDLKIKSKADSGSKKEITVLVPDINTVLGTDIPKEEMISILNRMDIEVVEKGEELALSVPAYRTDISNWRDIPEEIGRIWGYEKIPSILPQNKTFKPQVEKTFYYSEKIKNILADMGFSEVMTYALASKGAFQIEKSVASDKNFLRENLIAGITKSLELNFKNSVSLGLDEIKIFEIGKVFPKEGEHTSLCIGIRNVKKKPARTTVPRQNDLVGRELGGDVSVNEKIRNTREHLLGELGSKLQTLCTTDDSGGLLTIQGKQIGVINVEDGVLELDLDLFTADLSLPDSYDDLKFAKAPSFEYKKFSSYPSIVRDIAVFIPEKENAEVLSEIIKKEAGELLVKLDLFDVFTKDGKTSYAYRIILQSFERTLTDVEANEIMEKIYVIVKEKNWTVR